MVSKNKNRSPKSSTKLKTQTPNKRNNRKYYLLGGILILTIILFSGITSNEFTNWDDDKYIIKNTILKDLSPKGIMEISSTFVSANYHPLTVFVFALEYKAFGFNPSGFHYVSLVLHLINIVLVFFLFQLLGFKEKIILPICLLFAIHPMHVESVAWISEQKDLLYAGFFIASLITYLLYIKNNKKLKWLLFSIGFFILSLLSKSMAVTLPLILLLIDWYSGRMRSKGIVIEKIPYFLLSVGFGILAIISQSAQGATDMVPEYSIIDRIFLACYAIVFYLYKLIIPVNLSVIHYYPIKDGGYLPFTYYLVPLVIIGVIYLFRRQRSDRKTLIFGSLFFIACISIVLQLLPVGEAIVTERYTYIPYLGLFMIASFYYNKLSENKKPSIRKVRPLLNGVLIIYIGILCFLTYQRTKVWENGITLFTNVIEKYPDNFHPYLVLAGAYADKGNIEMAIENCNKTIELNDQYMHAYINRGNIYSKSGKHLEAIEDFTKVIQMDPDYFPAYTNRGITYTRMEDYENAINDYSMAISLNPEEVISISERAQLYINQGRDKEALEELDRTISIDPEYGKAYSIRGVYYGQNGRYQESIDDLNRAVELNPYNSDIYINLGNVKVLMKDYLGAIEAFDKAIEVNPVSFIAYSNRGIAKLNLNLKNEACNDFRKAANMGHQKSRELMNKYCHE